MARAAWDQNAGLVCHVARGVRHRRGRRPDGCSICSACRANASVGFVTGAHMANITALAAARHEVLRRAGWDVEADGLQGAPRVRRRRRRGARRRSLGALRLLGIRRATARRGAGGRRKGGCCPTRLRDCARALRRSDDRLRPGRQREHRRVRSARARSPTLTRAHGAWLHVDGAFGLWAAAVPALRAARRAASSWPTRGRPTRTSGSTSHTTRASSFVAHPAAHRAAMSMSAAYLVRGRTEERDGDGLGARIVAPRARCPSMQRCARSAAAA